MAGSVFPESWKGQLFACSRMFLVQVWHKCRGTDCCIISAGSWFIPRRALIRFARSVRLVRSLNTVAFVGNSFYSIRSTLLHSNRKRNCLPCFRLSSSNKVQSILYKVLWVMKGKHTTEFYWRREFFSFCTERGRVFISRSYTDPWRRLSNWCNCNFSNNGKKCRRKSDGSAIRPNGNMLTCRLKSNCSESKRRSNRQTWKPCFNSLRIPLRWAGSCHLQPLRWRLFLLLRRLILLQSCGKIVRRGF